MLAIIAGSAKVGSTESGLAVGIVVKRIYLAIIERFSQPGVSTFT
jgi:hypothetical protein